MGSKSALPVDGKTFVSTLREWLEKLATKTDASFPHNDMRASRTERSSCSKLERRPLPEGFQHAGRALLERMPERTSSISSVIPIIGCTGRATLARCPALRPSSPAPANATSPPPSVTAAIWGRHNSRVPSRDSIANRSPGSISAMSVKPSWMTPLSRVVNAYNQFTLPQFWGSGEHVSADGMKWDVYEQNLLAEYHFAMAVGEVSGTITCLTTYIALFSRFIPCGVWEGTYILDGLMANASEIQPDIVHADTQGPEHGHLWPGPSAGHSAHATHPQLERSHAVSPLEHRHAINTSTVCLMNRSIGG